MFRMPPEVKSNNIQNSTKNNPPRPSASYSPSLAMTSTPHNTMAKSLKTAGKASSNKATTLDSSSHQSTSNATSSLSSASSEASWKWYQTPLSDSVHGVDPRHQEHQHNVHNLSQPRSEASTEANGSIEVLDCDNYGCHSYHDHHDCPLPKRCWGCRSPHHFWCECPMTCKDCGSARHTPQYCKEFVKLESYKIAQPRKVRASETNGTSADVPAKKRYMCDNYSCNEYHSHWDCPLPAICWGCRSRTHFWSQCEERCRKCGLNRHAAIYCKEFEYWKENLSRPNRIITRNLKRERELDIGCCEGPELHMSMSKKPRTHSTTAPSRNAPWKQDRHDPTRVAREMSEIKSQNKQLADARRGPETSLATQVLHEKSPPKGPYLDSCNSPFMQDTRPRGQGYCKFWLRNGICNFEHTPLGCKFKHEVPNQQLLGDMGIYVLPRAVTDKARFQPQPKEQTKELNRPLSRRAIQSSDATSRLNDKIAVVSTHGLPKSGPHSSPQQSIPLTATSTVTPSYHSPIAETAKTGPLPTRFPIGPDKSSIEKSLPTRFEREKAFEDEERFKQKRHEAEMRRRAEEHRLEYEHELKIVQLRRGRRG